LKFSTAIMAELAYRRFAPLMDGGAPARYDSLVKWLIEDKGLPVSMDDEAGFRKASKAVERAIRDAFHQRAVVIERRGSTPVHRRNDKLEAELQARFPALDTVIVVRADPRHDHGPESAEERSGRLLHQQLGEALAAYIAGQRETYFRDGDAIAVGGGRGVHHMIVALGASGRMRVNEVHVQSFSGSLAQYKSVGDSGLIWDADDNAMQLASLFAGSVHVGQIQHNIICREEQRNRLLAETHLSARRFAANPPHHGLFGLGNYDSGSYFYRDLHARMDLKRGPPSNEAAWGPHYEFYAALKRLDDKVKATQSFYGECSPVAEFGNRYFFVEMPPSAANGNRMPNPTAIQTLRTEFNGLIEEVNARLLNPASEQIEKISKLTLIAGSPSKVLAIRTLLMAPERRISHRMNDVDESRTERWALPTIRNICIDEKSAREILALSGAR
jgi:DNA-binding transcriptional regulator LsrR (DeoR family)